MNSPKISILIPVYNRNKYISECIDSALDQTFSDFEVVVVDNASDDGTWEICRGYAERDPRVRVFRNDENIGPVKNWIRCAKEARGEYSKMLFSDDLLERDCIEQMQGLLDNPDVGFVFCAARIGETKDRSVVVYSVSDSGLIGRQRYISLLLNNRSPYSPGAVMLRTRDLVSNLHTDFPTATKQQFDRHGAGPDIMIMLLTAFSYPGVMCICDPLVFFRVHANSFTAINANNAVSMGYTSAIAYFLRTNVGWYQWLMYLTRSWFETVREQGLWISPFRFLRANEGKGSWFEVLLGLIIIPFIVAKKIFGRTVRRLSAMGKKVWC